MTTKVCTKCGVEKELGEFYKQSRGGSGRTAWCRACCRKNDVARFPKEAARRRERRRVRHVSDPKVQQARRASKLRNKYGITLAEYDEMFEAQGGVCAICGRTQSDSRRLAVDHDHKTGKVRGLLCNPCNTGLGVLGDSSLQVMKAAMYLAEHGC